MRYLNGFWFGKERVKFFRHNGIYVIEWCVQCYNQCWSTCKEKEEDEIGFSSRCIWSENKSLSRLNVWMMPYRRPKTWYSQHQTDIKSVFRLYSRRCTADSRWIVFQTEGLGLGFVAHDSWRTSNHRPQVKSTATLFCVHEYKREMEQNIEIIISRPFPEHFLCSNSSLKCSTYKQ